MTSTFRMTLLGTPLIFALILIAGCQNQTTDLGESANQSASNGRRHRAAQLPPAVLQQVTLKVTGMS